MLTKAVNVNARKTEQEGVAKFSEHTESQEVRDTRKSEFERAKICCNSLKCEHGSNKVWLKRESLVNAQKSVRYMKV